MNVFVTYEDVLERALNVYKRPLNLLDIFSYVGVRRETYGRVAME